MSTGPKANRPPASLLIPAMLAAVVALAPLAYLFQMAFDRGAGYVVEEVFRSRTWDLVVRSGMLAVAVTAASVAIAVPAAWLVVRSDLRAARVWRVLLALPLAVPSYLAAFAWVSWRPSLAGFWGAFIVLTLVSYPYVYLPVTAAMRRLDPALDELAVIQGRGRPMSLLMLAARQTRAATAAGALLVALYVLSDFGAVATMRYDAFTWVIYGAYRAGFNPSRAAVLAGVLVVLAVVLVAAETRARGREVETVSRRSMGAPVRLALGRGAIVAHAGLFAVVAAALAFPVWRVLVWVGRGQGTDPVGSVFGALWASLRYSLAAAAITTVVALPVGLLASRYRSRTTLAIEASTYVTHGLPGIVVAIAMVFLGVRLLRPFYLEAPLLVLAYVVLFLPLAVGAVRAAADQIPRTLDDVARSLGSGPLDVVRRVSLPIIGPGVAAGAALVLLAAMKELPVTMLLHPTGVDTLATRLWTFTSVSDYAGAGPYALAMLVFVAVPTALATGRR